MKHLTLPNSTNLHKSPPHVGAWIETLERIEELDAYRSPPHVGAWIETPVVICGLYVGNESPPHVGAWIETECY